MRFCSASTVLVLFVGVAAGCAGGEEAHSETTAGACVPGEQVSCACPGGGTPGVQSCAADGSGFGACMGCDGGSSGGATSGDDDSSSGASATTLTSTSTSADGSTTEPGDVTGQPATESGGDMFVWVWVDHGGPAFLPPPCAATAGVVDGVLVDPQAFFVALVGGADPNDWEAVMNTIEPELWACGIGQQRNIAGLVRGRLFLPTEACPNAAPPADDMDAMFLGVRQEKPCWAHPVDVVMGP